MIDIVKYPDFDWAFCANHGQKRILCPKTHPIMADNPATGGRGTDHGCDVLEMGDVITYGGILLRNK